MEDHSISLEFSHSNIATVAFSLLQHRAASLFARPSGSISSARLFRPYIIDLTKAETTEDTVNNLTASKSCPPALPDSDDIYGDIGAYDDSGVETTDSEASVTSVREIQRSSASSPKYHSRSENEGPGKTLLPPDSRPRVVNRLPNGLHAVPQPPNWASISIPKTLRDASASPSPLPLAPDKENNEPHIQIVHLPRAAHNRARRVLLPNNSSLPIMTVSMRADFQFFHRTARCVTIFLLGFIVRLNWPSHRYRISRYSMPNNYSDRRHTSDAVMIGDFAAVGYRSSPCQVSVIHSREVRIPMLICVNPIHQTHAGSAAVVHRVRPQTTPCSAQHACCRGHEWRELPRCKESHCQRDPILYRRLRQDNQALVCDNPRSCRADGAVDYFIHNTSCSGIQRSDAISRHVEEDSCA